MRSLRCAAYGLALSATILVSSQVSALTGADLYKFCSYPRDSPEDLVCNTYIRGFDDGMLISSVAFTPKAKKRFCAPSKVIDLTQVRLIIDKFLREHPQILHFEAGVLGGLAISQAFPCNVSD